MIQACYLSIFLIGFQTPISEPPRVAELALVADVAAWARETGDSDAMLVAADLLQASTGGHLASAEGGWDIDGDRLLDEASRLARDESERARVAAKRSTLPRGIARALGGTGPIGRLVQVSPNRPLNFSITARGGEQALLHVGPTAGGELEVVIVDSQGQPFCRAHAPGRPVLCSWRPVSTADYRVSIRVISPVPVTTVIASN